ncbi:MAG: cadherin-like beta sandwich domain-containing protein [Clostridia bacterium]|nr:cadherin-like beta sandwich domain-containing protein [Clostridia bacterium]
MKKWLALLLCTFLMIAPCLIAHAACSASVSASQVYVGDTVKVTFTFKESKAVGSVDLTVQFDSAHLEYKSYTGSLGGSGVNVQGETIKISEYNSNNTSSTYTATFTFTAKAVGSAVVRVTSSDISDQDFISIDTSSASATVTVKAKNLPSDCNLTSLTPPAGCTLAPKFSPNTTSYTCSVPYAVEKFPLDWTLSDSKAKATPIGSLSLKVGTNTRSVRVTAQDGTTKTYTVTITRAAEGAATPVPTPVATEPPDIAVTIDGKAFTLSRTLHTALPDGFLQEKLTYRDEEVESGVMGSLRVVQINDGEEFDLYLFDETTGAFTLYHGLETTGEAFTILDKTPVRLPAGSEKTSVNGLPCWTIPLLGDGYYVVTALRHSTGKEFSAVYCEADGTLQTASGALLEGTAAAPVVTDVLSVTPTAAGHASDDSIDWMLVNMLVVVAGLLLIGVLIAVIVLIRHGSSSSRHPRKRSHDWGRNDPYDVVLSDDPETDDPAPQTQEKHQDDPHHVYTGEDDFE